MDFNSAKETAKKMIENYLQQKGIDTRKPFKCLSPAHADNNPSMSLDRAHNRVKCFSCGESYDIFDLIGIDYNISEPGAQMKRAFELFSLPVDSNRTGGSRKPDAPLNWDGTTAEAFPPLEPPATPANSGTAKSNTAVNEYIDKCALRVGATDYFSRRATSMS